jgi:hypothetical protein
MVNIEMAVGLGIEPSYSSLTAKRRHPDGSPTIEVVSVLRFELGVSNVGKRVPRWGDFVSGREARRSEYREYSQASQQSPEAKLAPALRVVAKIGAGFVGPLAHIRDMRFAFLRASTDFGHNGTCVCPR